ncbi:hypothetical protein DLJ49_10540 [Rhodovulum sp. 12E13]|nr:hypothetical protein DLJ49_10540 [Rhodovulum sp. 12E13]
MAFASTAFLGATVAFGQNGAGQADQGYAAELWQMMTERDLAGENAVQAFPYAGTDPHGMMLETFYTEATIDGHSGDLVIKRNYGPEGVTVEEVLGAGDDHLASITIMFRRGDGYAPDSGNWFWAKYLPNGSLDRAPDGTPLAGPARGCISCHADADGGDYLFTTNALSD